jgi:hypothetical protein
MRSTEDSDDSTSDKRLLPVACFTCLDQPAHFRRAFAAAAHRTGYLYRFKQILRAMYKTLRFRLAARRQDSTNHLILKEDPPGAAYCAAHKKTSRAKRLVRGGKHRWLK